MKIKKLNIFIHETTKVFEIDRTDVHVNIGYKGIPFWFAIRTILLISLITI